MGVANAETCPYHSVCLHIMHIKLLFFLDFYLRSLVFFLYTSIAWCVFEMKTAVARYPITYKTTAEYTLKFIC